MDNAKEDATFEKDDVFQRQGIGEGIIKSIKNQDSDHRGAVTISIDAPWGLGKTTFIYMLKNWIIEKEPEWRTVYYDAWQNDMTEDPFTSLLFRICGQCGEKALTVKEKNEINHCAINITDTVGKILECIPNPVTMASGKFVQAIINFINPKKGESFTDKYDQFQKHQEALRNELQDLAKQKIIVFVDELDRCRPTFAVHILETIKHYFDVNNIVFIFAIDGIQLRETIKKYYGDGFDSSSYLSRFFEQQILMPKPTLNQMIEFCTNSMKLSDEMLQFLHAVFDYEIITAREVRSIVKGIETVVNNVLSKTDIGNTNIYHPAIAITGLLLSLKCKKMKDYESVIQAQYKALVNLDKTKDEIEKGLETLSNYCGKNVEFVRRQMIKDNSSPILESVNINNALQKMLVKSSNDLNIGNELKRLMNLIEISEADDTE